MPRPMPDETKKLLLVVAALALLFTAYYFIFSSPDVPASLPTPPAAQPLQQQYTRPATEPEGSNAVVGPFAPVRYTVPWPSGVPTTAALQKVTTRAEFIEMELFANAFLAHHKAALSVYSKLWVPDPFHWWSRVWEYPFTWWAMSTLPSIREDPNAAFQVADLGSGVTFLPFFLATKLPGATVTCFDFDTTYPAMFRHIASAEPQSLASRVKFAHQNLLAPPFTGVAANTFDVVYSVSVVEHFTDWEKTVDFVSEVQRILKPGGYFIVTMDTVKGQQTGTCQVLEQLRHVFSEVNGDPDLVASSGAYNGPDLKDFSNHPDVHTRATPNVWLDKLFVSNTPVIPANANTLTFTNHIFMKKF